MKSPSVMSLAAIGICLLTVVYFAANYLVTAQLHEKTAAIYEHPYTVSNAAREMRTRLLDMRSFITMMLTFGSKDTDEARRLLQQRYSRQDKSINDIVERYIGPAEDTRRLKDAIQALKDAQEEALAVAPSLTEQEVALYVQEKLYPRYDAIRDRLGVIIAVANGHMRTLERESAVTARISTLSTGLLCLLIIGLVVHADRLERSKNRELSYRESLCNIIAARIDDVFFIYNKSLKRMEFVSANCRRVLGLEEQCFCKGLQALEDILPPQEMYKVNEILGCGISTEQTEREFMLNDPATGAPRPMKLRIYPHMEKQKVTRYIFAISPRPGNSEQPDPREAPPQKDREPQDNLSIPA